jgi:hypothetical protein
LTNSGEEKPEKNSDAASGTLFRVSKCFSKKKEETLHLFVSLKW